jgi:hypothetical protein
MIRRDVDWASARAEYEAGATYSAIGRRHKVTRQAVTKRALREQWQRSPDAAALAKTDTARRLEQPATPQERRLAAGVGGSKRSMSAAQRLVDMLGLGATPAIAAKRLGMSEAAVRVWLEQDPQLAALCEQAQGDFVASLVERIGEAAARDWRAAAHLVERHPASREEYQPAQQAAPAGGAPILQIVLPPDLAAVLTASAPTPARPTIDHEPLPEGDEA